MTILAFAVAGRWATAIRPTGNTEDVVNNPGKVAAGNAVYIEYEVRDQSVSPTQLTADFDSIVISLYDPDTLEAAVEDAEMDEVKPGRYSYTHQTAEDDSHGTWLASVKTTKIDAACPPGPDVVNVSPREAIFILTGPSGV